MSSSLSDSGILGAQIILSVSDCEGEYLMEMHLCCGQPNGRRWDSVGADELVVFG